ncbi:MAG: cysteine--tRNA ligase [Chitinophagaceae bacterium]|nr:cysteine--tRNA ligase [Oligoflexus sp.]
MRDIQVYNTLTGKKEKLETLEPSHVKLYACGVTVYDDCHIGHAMQAIYFDVIRTYLEYVGYKVTYVRNYTDVDDKIIKRSQERGITPKALVDEIIASSERDMKGLGVKPATFEPRVSESIPEIIGVIQDLETNGFAYSTPEGDVYYRVRKKTDYGKLSNRKTEELQSGTRDLVKGDKEDELDFALWKKDNTEGASWDSPWGRGRPGWHIECSAMAKMYLGKSFDIHGGGRDLVFPHHENEIAQSEAANSCPYSTYWMHSGLLTINKTKMSKSLGNSILTSKFLQRFPGEVLRLAYLQNHYTSNVDFSEQVFRSSAQRLLYFYETMRELDQIASPATGAVSLLPGHKPDELIEAFHREMTNDFGTVGALREILLAFRKANELRQGKPSPAKVHTAAAYAAVFRELFGVFGLVQAAPEDFIQSLKSKIVADLGIEESKIESLITARKTARDTKNFARGDEIRAELTAMGIELMDGPQGTRWTLQWKDEEGK